MSRTFTDEPMVRNLHPENNHDGMAYLVLTAGFCLLDGNSPTVNSDSWGSNSLSYSGGASTTAVTIKPDLPTLGRPGEKCLNASLELWLQEPIDDSYVLSLHRLLKDWVRDEVTWNEAASGDSWDAPGLTAGVDYQLTAEVSDSIGNLRGSPVVSFNLDTWINDVCNDGADNFGFVLFLSHSGDAGQVVYGEGAPFQFQPRLVLNTAIGDTYACEADTSINETNPAVNYGTNPLVSISDPFGAGNSVHGLFRFTVEDLDPGAELVEALLSCTPQTANTSAVYGVYPMLVPWVETEATWNEASSGVNWGAAGLQAGVDYDDTQRIEWTVTNAVNEEVQLDIIDFVKSWLNGVMDNNGIVIRYENVSASSKNWNSRESAGLDPYIELTYRN